MITIIVLAVVSLIIAIVSYEYVQCHFSKFISDVLVEWAFKSIEHIERAEDILREVFLYRRDILTDIIKGHKVGNIEGIRKGLIIVAYFAGSLTEIFLTTSLIIVFFDKYIMSHMWQIFLLFVLTILLLLILILSAEDIFKETMRKEPTRQQSTGTDLIESVLRHYFYENIRGHLRKVFLKGLIIILAPNIPKLDIEPPLFRLNTYLLDWKSFECFIRKLKRIYSQVVIEKANEIEYVLSNEAKCLPKWVEFHADKSPLEIFCTLMGKRCSDNVRVASITILNDTHDRTLVKMILSFWKGCNFKRRIRYIESRRGKRAELESHPEPAVLMSVAMIGYSNHVRIVEALLDLCFRKASEENIFCIGN